jgi:hypothetical protein
VRLDRALLADLRTALAQPALLAYLALQILAAAVLVWRTGESSIETVALVWVAMVLLAFFAWWAGRHRLAHPQADPVPAARARAVFALIAVAGMLVAPLYLAAGIVLFACGLGGWLWAALRSGGFVDVRARLLRDPRPFIPLMLFIAVPRLVFGGPAYVVGALLALPSGIGQQLMYLIGLYGPVEASGLRRSMAAVLAALIFAAVHVPILLPSHDGDIVATIANAVLFQSAVGLVACLAYTRHRAVVPIGVAHALAIG